MSQPATYTAAQLARALGISPRAASERLADTPISAAVKVRGQRAKAWAVAAFPPALRVELNAAAVRRGVADVEQLLAAPSAPYAPPVPWHAIPQAYRTNAEKLCAALSPALALQHELTGPDLMDLARAGYRAQFGNVVADDKLRYTMDRATKRDNHFNQWERPCLYLDESAFGNLPDGPLRMEGLHVALDGDIAAIADRSNPSDLDRRHLLSAAFRHFEKLVTLHPAKGEQRAIKGSLVNFLYQNIPGLYRPQAAGAGVVVKEKPLLAVRAMFNRVYGEWIALGRTAVLPAAVHCGRKPYEHAPCDRLIISHAARLRGEGGKRGNLDLAIQTLAVKRAICAECASRYSPARISAAARERLTPNIIQVAYFKGPDAVRKVAPTHHCDWSDTEAGDRFVIDDMTTNEIAWDEVDGQIISGQAQLLFTEDERSGYPLPFLLYFGPPNGNTIKKEIALVLRHVGLPRVELVTERGVFAARKLAGARNVKHDLGFRELQAAMETHFKFDAVPDDVLTEMRKHDLGLRDPVFRLKISQARSPQAKTVERGFYELQKSASRLPGFAGFNQRNEKTRAMQDFDRRVAIGKEHPGSEYLHLGELRKNYELIFEEIANRPANGVRCRGQSPLEVWKESVSRRPLTKLPEEIEAHLSTHRLPRIKVQAQGVCVTLSKDETAFYFNEATGPFVGRHVAVRVNYEIPDYIYIEHPDTEQLMKIPRALTKRRTATPEEIAAVNRARRAHINGALGEIGNVQNIFTAHVVRDRLHSQGDMDKGAQIAADAEQHKVEQSRTAREQKHRQRIAGALGTTVPANPRNGARVDESLDLEAEALAEIAASEKGSPQ